MPNVRPRPRSARRIVTTAVTAALLAGAAAACSSSSSGSAAVGASSTSPAGPSGSASAATSAAGTPVAGGTLQWALANDPLSISPWGGGSGNDQLYVTRQIFDTLVEQDPKNGQILPFLATKWSVNANATSFTFTLRSGVTFSDGTPLTAQVVKENFDEIAKAGAAATWVAGDFAGYESTTVTGPLTFTVSFSKPDGPFIQQLSGVDIVAASTLKIPYGDWAAGKGVIGSGPFVLQSYTPGQSVILTRRDGYDWGPSDRTNKGGAYLNGIDFKITPEPSVRTGVLTSGQVQAIDNVQPQDISTLRGDGHDILARANPGIAFSLTFVQNNPTTEQLQVRQAIADAINPTAIRDAVLTNDFAVATSILSNDTVGYVNLSGDLTYNATEAGKLLSAAGWVPGPNGIREKDGKPLNLTLGWVNNFAPNQNALQLLQAELKQVGVNTTLETGTVPQYLSELQAGKFNLVWGNLSNSNAAVLRTQFASNGTNYYKLSDSTLDGYFAQEYSTGSQTAQDSWAAKAQQRILQQVYAVPVFQLTTVIATSSSVHGVEFGSDSRLAQLTDAWIGSQQLGAARCSASPVLRGA
jgi:peptide/nickel transport system substrate-binding protein